ncbi:MAG: FtsX-like permease family protein [Paludibacter sp.]|nr:FtsX-like permease family protein [Paludibacter sp.]
MIRFLFKGLIRDKSRSLLPIIVVTVGVMMTVFLQAYMNGIFSDSIESTAKFSSGHVKVMTSAYKNNLSQMPNDYAITGVVDVLKMLRTDYPDMTWTDRIQFGGLLDAPDSSGNTRSQGNVMGMGLHLIGTNDEINRMDLSSTLLSGNFPKKRGDILVTDELCRKMNLKIGDEVTLMSGSMYGDMAMYNFRISGIIHFGTETLDRGLVVADIEDVRYALDMEDAAGEILGFFNDSPYDNKRAVALSDAFNAKYTKTDDKFSLAMLPMSGVGGMDFLIAYSENAQFIIILIFVFAMSIVLWNAGLVGGLRRYGEFGLRLAIGENKHEIYRSLIGESLLVGLIGSVIGIVIGLFFSYLMQKYGIDTSGVMKNSQLMMPTIFRSQINVTTYYIGFIPGVISTVIGAALAGIGIYKRQTANLFKELEN